MISRRNIRVKVMQTLYMMGTQDQAAMPSDAIKILQKHFDQTRQLLVYLIHFITELSRYAETDSLIRSSKHLPNEEDRNVNTKLAGNELLWKIMEDVSYQKALQADKLHLLKNTDLVRKMYYELRETVEYKKYITEEGRNWKSEKEMLQFIFSDFLLTNEEFENYVEDCFTNWDDDAEMMSKLLPAYFSKPQSFNFQEILSKEKWEFGKGLLQTVMEKKEITLGLIKPKLKNWDPDRIAMLDMILMEMGVSEFLYFETIPPKVTINEYIDLAKEYSTQQSGQFVNGILDNIHKDLVKENKMHKINFKTP
jgi:N utilization substance protein B